MYQLPPWLHGDSLPGTGGGMQPPAPPVAQPPAQQPAYSMTGPGGAQLPPHILAALQRQIGRGAPPAWWQRENPGWQPGAAPPGTGGGMQPPAQMPVGPWGGTKGLGQYSGLGGFEALYGANGTWGRPPAPPVAQTPSVPSVPSAQPAMDPRMMGGGPRNALAPQRGSAWNTRMMDRGR